MRLELFYNDIEIKKKSDSFLMKAIDIFLKAITLWQMNGFMHSFTTTIGETMYVASKWDDREEWKRMATLRHEYVHILQKKRWGMFMFTWRYLCWPLPTVLAWGRRDIEQEAYAETMRAYAEHHGIACLRGEKLRAHICGTFTGSSYFWTYPFKKKIEGWYDRTRAELEEEFDFRSQLTTLTDE